MKKFIWCVWIILVVVGCIQSEAAVQDNRELAKFFRLKAQWYITIFRYREAEIYFEKALKVAPGEASNYIEYSTFLQGKNKLEKNIELCKKGLENLTGDADRAPLLIILGSFYAKNFNFKDAEPYLTEASEKYRTLAKINPDSYLNNLRETLNYLGNLYNNTSRFTEAEKIYTEALEINRKFSQTNTEIDLFKVADTLNNLGLLYWRASRFKEAEQVYTEGLGISRKIAGTNPANYLPHLGEILNNLGLLYCQTARYSEACPVLHEALSIREELAQQNTATSDQQLSQTIVTLVLLYKRAPNACTPVKDISELRDQAIAILKKYPDVPEAQQMLKMMEKLK